MAFEWLFCPTGTRGGNLNKPIFKSSNARHGGGGGGGVLKLQFVWFINEINRCFSNSFCRAVLSGEHTTRLKRKRYKERPLNDKTGLGKLTENRSC